MHFIGPLFRPLFNNDGSKSKKKQAIFYIFIYDDLCLTPQSSQVKNKYAIVWPMVRFPSPNNEKYSPNIVHFSSYDS